MPDTFKLGQQIFIVQGMGKPKYWKRFPKLNEWGGWSNSGRYGDSITFIPSKKIYMCGFSTYSSKEESSYEMKWECLIDK